MMDAFTEHHARQEIQDKIRRAAQRRIASRARTARRARRTPSSF